MSDQRPNDDERPFWAGSAPSGGDRAPESAADGLPGQGGLHETGLHETVAYGAPDEHRWSDPVVPTAAAGPPRRRTVAGVSRGAAVAVVAAAVVVGGAGVAALSAHSSGTTAVADQGAAGTGGAGGVGPGGTGTVPQGTTPQGTLPEGMLPPGGKGFPGGGWDGFGGAAQAGEDHVRGTIAAVDPTTITIKASSGTTRTYAVSSSTEVIKNGARSSVSALKAGDVAVVHVITSGSSPTVERILVGMPRFGGRHMDGRDRGMFGDVGPGGGFPPMSGGSGTGSGTTGRAGTTTT